MRFAVVIGGVKQLLDPAAISCLRYRAEYGHSVVTDLFTAETDEQRQAYYVRLVHAMIPDDERPDLLEFAQRCLNDPQFYAIASMARDALLSGCEKHVRTGEAPSTTEQPYDEYQVLALMTAAGVDIRLIYELPIMHLLEVASQCFAQQGAGEKTYSPMTETQMASLYPR